jgi:hypothetical protein
MQVEQTSTPTALAIVRDESPMLMNLKEDHFAGCRAERGFFCITDCIARFLGKTQKQAANLMTHNLTISKNEKVEYIKFPRKDGRMSQGIACVTFSDLLQLLAQLPGKYPRVMQVRGDMAHISTRAIIGCSTLEQSMSERRAEVSPEMQRGLLTGMTNTVQEQPRLAGTKRVRGFHADMAMYAECFNMFGITIDSREKLMVKDIVMNSMTGGEVATNKPVQISTVFLEVHGRAGSTADYMKIGSLLAKAYRAKYGKDPEKHDQFVGGAVRRINTYYEQDLSMIQEAVRGYQFVQEAQPRSTHRERFPWFPIQSQ